MRRPPRSTLFPSTTLSRSGGTSREPRGLVLVPTRELAMQVTDVLTPLARTLGLDRKSTRLNSSHANISYAVFCLKKKTPTMHSSTIHKHTPLYLAPTSLPG